MITRTKKQFNKLIWKEKEIVIYQTKKNDGMSSCLDDFQEDEK